MSLKFKKLHLQDFRNINNREISFSDELTILIGKNAVGKTNSIEALQLLTSGTTFRNSRPIELIGANSVNALISGVIEGDGRIIDVACNVVPGKKKLTKNGKKVKPEELGRILPSILFYPDDLSFIKGSASYRRHELDNFASQVSDGYYKILTTYTHSIEQRNKLLKEDFVDLDMLAAWNISVALGGATLLKHRYTLFERLKDEVEAIYPSIAHGEYLTCNYVCSLGINPSGLSREELKDIYLDKLEQTQQDDLRRGMTQIGPHRDDISFEVSDRDARTYCSQGQQRTIVLAWKMGEVELCEKITSQKPLLLLDDVMSELDKDRRQAITSLIEQGIQAVITTTNLEYFPEEVLQKAKVVRYE